VPFHTGPDQTTGIGSRRDVRPVFHQPVDLDLNNPAVPFEHRNINERTVQHRNVMPAAPVYKFVSGFQKKPATEKDQPPSGIASSASSGPVPGSYIKVFRRSAVSGQPYAAAAQNFHRTTGIIGTMLALFDWTSY
jgi:hypothetical protein